ncbi:thioredoxin fold domain-containing protein [Acidithiobacillus ferrooxidans]|uniref:thioredoxin fold domain-containing protein n=1 Tax=Acidithiobacillus ferrooxidans TaxID=920 RepID=UPI001C072F42|nr:thioredoxin fold domain-containing protein [Acidithiobacillus ferrooxidans]MBU2856430.1 thioredoxin fold domain-containing protein [Acidithiobacillus ferrooxidans]MBU2860076.1 thioredoxin fold domain-containing protein [Acidithiobacillus ferrooxidans]
MKNRIRTVLLKWLGIGVFSSSLLFFGMTFAEAQASTAALPKKLTANVLWKQILAQHLTYIQEGHHGPIIYDFQDPNCPYCHVMYTHEAPLIKAGKLTVRYVPVAFLTPQSPAEAADWLQSPHPLATLKHFESIVGPALRSGDYRNLPKAIPTAKTTQDLKHNLEMMGALGFDGTPAILYRLKSGHLGGIPGMISEKQLSGLLPHLQ